MSIMDYNKKNLFHDSNGPNFFPKDSRGFLLKKMYLFSDDEKGIKNILKMDMTDINYYKVIEKDEEKHQDEIPEPVGDESNKEEIEKEREERLKEATDRFEYMIKIMEMSNNDLQHPSEEPENKPLTKVEEDIGAPSYDVSQGIGIAQSVPRHMMLNGPKGFVDNPEDNTLFDNSKYDISNPHHISYHLKTEMKHRNALNELKKLLHNKYSSIINPEELKLRIEAETKALYDAELTTQEVVESLPDELNKSILKLLNEKSIKYQNDNNKKKLDENIKRIEDFLKLSK